MKCSVHLRRVVLVLGLLLAFGTSARAQTVSLNPPCGATFNFPGVPLSGTSAPQCITVTCTGEMGTCVAVSLGFTGPSAADFQVMVAGGFFAMDGVLLLMPGQTGTLCVTFRRSTCGAESATLGIVAVGSNVFSPCSYTLTAPLIAPPPTTTAPITFPSTLAGTPGATVCLPLPAGVIPLIAGPNFTIVPGAPGQVCIQFTPPAAACGTVTGSLVFVGGTTACPLVIVPLQGFACSFTCAIGLAGSANLTAAGRKCILDSLQIAAATTGAARCAALRCAECCAKSEVAAGRAGAQAVLDQIRCLETFFGCAPFPC